MRCVPAFVALVLCVCSRVCIVLALVFVFVFVVMNALPHVFAHRDESSILHQQPRRLQC